MIAECDPTVMERRVITSGTLVRFYILLCDFVKQIKIVYFEGLCNWISDRYIGITIGFFFKDRVA